jgi:uncharacterized protein (DUF1800 family)
MLLYLDGARSRKGEPNENFARELLELFTLGEEHYTEADIKAAARAFTGWTIDRRTGDFTVQPRRHDNGIKDFLGWRGEGGRALPSEVWFAPAGPISFASALAPLMLMRKIGSAGSQPSPTPQV